VSADAVAVDGAAVEVERLAGARSQRRALSGEWLLSGAMLLSGVLTYVFNVVAARSLGPHGYGHIAVLWAGMFLAATVLFRPLEQTASRAIVVRRARGHEASSVMRAVATICGLGIIAVLAGAALAHRPLADRLFGGDTVLTAMLAAGVAMFGIVHVGRGLLGGTRWFGGYAAGLVADGVIRLAIAAPLLVVASVRVAGAAVVAAGLLGVAVPLVAGRRRLRAGLQGAPGGRFQVRSALAFAAPASIISAADQLLGNGGPVVVAIEGGRGASAAAGVVFAATMLVRAPVFVFQGLAAALLPNLTHLHATADDARFRRSLVTTAGFLLAAGGIIAVLAATVGPTAMHAVYGPGYTATHLELAELGAGVGLYLAACTLSQALLARDRGSLAAGAWTVTTLTFVALYGLVDGAALHRISVAFLCAAGLVAGVLAVAVYRSARATKAHPQV
jgi:O-antigen/teichoic acid export membrane protein